jgi:uncharacterized protein YkwD
MSFECSNKGISHSCALDNYKSFSGSCLSGENVLSNHQGNLALAGNESVQQWLDSPGHYMNAMKPAFTHVGYGYFKCPFDSGFGDMFWTGLYFEQCTQL